MNKLIAVISFVLSLYGCDVGGSTFVLRTGVDGGADVLYSKAQARAGIARFECLASSSGQCHYTVFPPRCAPATRPADPGPDRCRSEPPKRFALASGDSRQIPGVAPFGVCVSAGSASTGPDCHVPQAMASR